MEDEEEEGELEEEGEDEMEEGEHEIDEPKDGSGDLHNPELRKRRSVKTAQLGLMPLDGEEDSNPDEDNMSDVGSFHNEGTHSHYSSQDDATDYNSDDPNIIYKHYRHVPLTASERRERKRTSD